MTTNNMEGEAREIALENPTVASSPTVVVAETADENKKSAAEDNDSSVKDDDDTTRKQLRLVSLLPSITEVLTHLGVGADEIVGITHECDYPEWVVNNKATVVVTTSEINPRELLTQEEIHKRVTGSLMAQGNSLYGLNHEALLAVKPDIIFTQSLCDVCAVSYPVVLDTCAKILAGPTCSINKANKNCDFSGGGDGCNEPQVISMEPNNLEDVLKTFHVAAQALGRPSTVERAKTVVADLERGFETIREQVQKVQTTKNGNKTKKRRPTVAFLEWHAPIFSGGHWIPDMLEIAGGDYRMCRTGDRSAAWSDEDFIKLDPDVILVGPCGFSLERALQDTLALLYHDPKRGKWWKQMRAVQAGRVYALDGNSYYARPGPRLLQGCGIMAKCIHDDNGKEELDLSEELAPSSGYCRITPEMYNEKDDSL